MVWRALPSRLLGSAVAAALAALGPPAVHAAEPLPRTPEDLIQKRKPMAPVGDVFGARSWAPPLKKPKAVPAPQIVAPPPPQPPALPFTYGGSGVVNGRTILFLEQPHRSLMVQPGDVIDGVYRVEALEANRALLRYLPLDAVQPMAFGTAGGAAQAAMAAIPAAARGPLFLRLPDEVQLGQELPGALGIPAGSMAARATIELTYDAQVLRLTGAKIVRPGKALVEVNAQDPARSKEIRLKAIAEATAPTEIGIAAAAFDAQGKSVEVRGIPSLHIVNLVDDRG